MLRDAAQSGLFEILDLNGIPFEHNRGENVLVITDTSSRIIFRPVDEFERLRGTNLAWFGLDELTYTPEEAWLRLEARLRDPQATRLCGFAAWTPKGYDWVYRRFIRESVDGYDVTIAAPFENRHVLEKVPDYYERLRRSYDERFFEQEVLGRYLNVNEGLAYHAFDRATHVADVELDGSRPLLWALDFNVNPMCSVVAQIQEGRVVVVDEIVIGPASTPEVCEEFRGRYGKHRGGVVIYGDASGNRAQTTGRSDYDMMTRFFERAGFDSVRFQVPSSNPGVRERVNLLNAMLRSADGEVQLLINGRCRELILDLEQVSFKRGSTIIDKDKDPRRTHLSDALGYLVWQECRPRGPVGEQWKRLF